MWEIETLIREAQLTEPDPGIGPTNRIFVPVSVRSQVLQWVHTSRFACHPGIFLWPTMDADNRAFVAACTVCARGKSSHRLSAGLLRPLPVPGNPWSHIALNIDTGLPPSQGNTVNLTISTISQNQLILWLTQNPPGFRDGRPLG